LFILILGVGFGLASLASLWAIYKVVSNKQIAVFGKLLLGTVLTGVAVYFGFVSFFQIAVFVGCKLWDLNAHIPCV